MVYFLICAHQKLLEVISNIEYFSLVSRLNGTLVK